MKRKILSLLLAFSLLGVTPAMAGGSGSGSMVPSNALLKFIEHYEGFRSTCYLDGGSYYIGFGVQVNPADYPNGITYAQAEAMLREKSADYAASVNTLEKRAGVAFTQSQFDALVSLTYNLGAGWMNEGHALYNIIMNGITGYSADEVVNAFGEMCHVGGAVSEGHVWRRVQEARMFLYGDYRFFGSPNYEYTVYPGQSPDIVLRQENGLITATFSDVLYTDWFYKYVSPLWFSGVIDGYADKTFRPQNDISAGEVLKLVIIAAGFGEKPAAGGHWASGYLSFAEQQGFIKTSEMPDLSAPVSRLTVARLTARALGIPESSDASPFADVSDGLVTALYASKILEGSYSGSSLVYKPDSTITRAEISAIVWRCEMYTLGGI